MRNLILGLFLCSLLSCSFLDVAKEVVKGVVAPDSGGGLSVDTELVVGDKQENTNVDSNIQVGDRNDNRQEAENITNETVVNNKGVPWWMLLIALLFWELPRSSDMFKWLRNKVRGKNA